MKRFPAGMVKTENGFSRDRSQCRRRLSEALIGLLEYQPKNLKGSWEGLAVKIAKNKAIDALRASRTGLRGTDHRHELHLVSGDTAMQGPDGQAEVSLS